MNLLVEDRKFEKLALEESAAEIRITHPEITLTLTRATGEITLKNSAERVLASGFYPHAGRRLTEAELIRSRQERTWNDGCMHPASAPETSARRNGDGIMLNVRGHYPRAGSPEQSLDGGIQLLVRNNGAIDIEYSYQVNSDVSTSIGMTSTSRETAVRWSSRC